MNSCIPSMAALGHFRREVAVKELCNTAGAVAGQHGEAFVQELVIIDGRCGVDWQLAKVGPIVDDGLLCRGHQVAQECARVVFVLRICGNVECIRWCIFCHGHAWCDGGELVEVKLVIGQTCITEWPQLRNCLSRWHPLHRSPRRAEIAANLCFGGRQ